MTRNAAKNATGTRGALQSVRAGRSPRSVAGSTASSRNSRLVQSVEPGDVPQVLGSAIPLCRWPFPRLCGIPFARPRRSPLSDQCTLSSSYAFLQSILQPDLAGWPQPASSSRGLSVPSALQGSEVHWPRRHPAAATFRPQGLVTLSAAYSLRARAGHFSYRRRSWDFTLRSFLLPAGIHHVSVGMNPRAVYSVGNPVRCEAEWAGPTDRGFWAFTLPGVPGARHWIRAPDAGCSLGLDPFRASRQQPRTGFRPRSSRALRRSTAEGGIPTGAPEYQSTAA
jgi:hypothetical protein